MKASKESEAKREINKTLTLSTFSMKRIGLALEKPANINTEYREKAFFLVCFLSLSYHVFADIMFMFFTFAKTPRIKDVVPYFHTFGYGVLSITKVFVLWYKKDAFRQLIDELSEIWPMPPLDENVKSIKEKSLEALALNHRWYFGVNVIAIWFYNLTPIVVYYYKVWQGQEAEIGFVWVGWYPFDKHQPVAHVAVYLFEVFAGVSTVWIMIASDLLFSGMASHIVLLLRILQQRLGTLGSTAKTEDEQYVDIVENVKLHQRLINYCNSIEEAFSFVNLVNIVMSSVNICCVAFVIVLLEPLISISNKLFLMSALLQMGVLCWYADDIFHANELVAKAAYNCKWYEMSPRCRRAILFLLARTRKPIAFTAMKFANISLVTYSSWKGTGAGVIAFTCVFSPLCLGLANAIFNTILAAALVVLQSLWAKILTRSYSYFALLYQMYDDGH